VILGEGPPVARPHAAGAPAAAAGDIGTSTPWRTEAWNTGATARSS
jgi:hypothetical protein